MLPFGLKILWFILSLTGLVGCWVTLWSFGRVVGTRWASIVYCIGMTFAHGIFCLGIVYNMDPILMARPFCFVQNAFLATGNFISMGVVLAFTLATSMAVRKPKTWGDTRRALQWQKYFYLPVFVVPVLATASYLTFSFTFDSVDPSDGMWCDSVEPVWVRLLGPSGIPFLFSIPVLYLSVQSCLRIRRINLHLLRSRPDCAISSTFKPTLSRTGRRNCCMSFRDAMPVSLAQSISRKSYAISKKLWKGRKSVAAFVDGGVGVTTKTENGVQGQTEFCFIQGAGTFTPSLPPTPLPLALLKVNGGSAECSPNGSAIVIGNSRIGGRTVSNVLDIHDITREKRRSTSRSSFQDDELSWRDWISSFSSPSPDDETPAKSIASTDRDGERFATGTPAGQMFRISVVDVGYDTKVGVHPASAFPKHESKDSNLHTLDRMIGDSVYDQRDDGETLEVTFASDIESVPPEVDSEDTDDDSIAKKLSTTRNKAPASMIFTREGPYKKPKHRPAWLAPALWHVILFQFAFVFIRFLAFLTTFVDVASDRRPPSPFGSQHLALLLAAWCPVVIFGALPVVRRNLIPWRPILIS